MRLIDGDKLLGVIAEQETWNVPDFVYESIKNAPTIDLVLITKDKIALVVGQINDKDASKYEELEINPCRGCEDYDGKGGCLSNGGCANVNEVEL